MHISQSDLDYYVDSDDVVCQWVAVQSTVVTQKQLKRLALRTFPFADGHARSIRTAIYKHVNVGLETRELLENVDDPDGVWNR